MQLADLRIAIIGLGYVGLPLAVEFGKKGPVIGFDINQNRIDELKSGKDHTLEVSPEELQKAEQLSFSANLDDLKTSNFFIVTVPTPVDQVNRPDLTPLKKASETVGQALKRAILLFMNQRYIQVLLKKYVFQYWKKYRDLNLIRTFCRI